mmetsp:Transcript_27968/g.63283  ORF Transcript_27968/g.63283 Transcript_27968/m.63283 type:complete len:88 (+) Transcript_27968:83-346(+)|eukprot:CAMPEP_0181208278 /NCGR_PEP_ID=MMETSP1096-20121128/22034_1 /TAXON_ID=156174 ORGANISM="Chrysochromulina ericina, Strain CCMP281" /NCGR_SAMPLE_ID=MMETSP1096 /ASSEMBLY_ACC=CAM_ASM_000453 /LENGTH=87 /DNA_ID=CAMNT_0023299335 /DNA_START=65 /DNA_END=328 /DNA_ORIENTATION=-
MAWDIPMSAQRGASAVFTSALNAFALNVPPAPQLHEQGRGRSYSEPELSAAQSLLQIEAGSIVSFGFAAEARGCFGAFQTQAQELLQ